MNHVYRLKRSGRTQQLQPVPETARAAGKGKRTGKTLAQTVTATLASVALGGVATLAYAQQAPPAANQLPQGGVVTRGSAHIVTSTSGSTALMSVNQSSQRAVIDWTSFNVGSQAKVQFNQPSSSAVTLNNILGHNASQIYGQISANGQVFLSNPNGVYFSPTAQVNVGGLVATTGKANADEFMAGKVTFNRDGSIGSVVNEGRLSAAAGGYIALLAPEVRNQGVVIAQAGTVALASGEAITLNFNHTGTGLAGITTTPQAIAALVENRSAVVAEGGQIILSAHALASLQGSVVKNSGQLSATSLSTQGGKIVLMGDSIALTGTSQIQASGATGGGTVLVGGDWQGSGDTRQATQVTMASGASIEANATGQGDGGKVVLWSDVHKAGGLTQVEGRIDAKGAGTGNGGQVETSGHTLQVGAQTQVNTGGGEWLLDPSDITISSGTTSGIALSSNTYTPTTGAATSVVNATTLVGNLATNNINITTTNTGTSGAGTGNITVAADLSWASPRVLTLTAAGGISGTGNISMTGTSGTGLVINQAGNSTYAGSISGSTATFTKQGAGNLTLTGTTNTYAGSTKVSAGTLTAGVNNAFGTGDIDLDGGTLNLGAYSQTSGQVKIRPAGGTVTSTSGVLTGTSFSFGSSSPVTTISANLAGPASPASRATVIHNGTGKVILTGNLTNIDSFNISSGVLQIGDGSSAKTFDVTGGLTVSSAATLAFNRTADTVLTNLVSATASGTFANLAYGTVLDLSGTNIGSSASYYLNTLSPSVNMATATPTVASIRLRANPILTGKTFNVLTTGFQSSFTNVPVVYWDGNSSGTLSALKLNGVTVAADGQAVGGKLTKTLVDVYIGPGALWSFTTAGSTRYITGTSDATDTTLSGTSSIVVPTGVSATQSGAISDTVGAVVGLTVSGGGTLTLSGNNSNFSGGTTLSAGTLKAGSSTAFGIGPISVTSGATLDLNGQTITGAGNLTLNGTGVNNSGALMNSGGAATYPGLVLLGSSSSIIGGSGSIALTSSSFTGITGTHALTLGGSQGGSIATGIKTSSGTVTKQDAGTWVLSGNSTYTGGTIINGGTLQISIDDNLGAVPGTAGTNITINGGTLAMAGQPNAIFINANRRISIGSSGGTIANNGGYALDVRGDITATGPVTLTGGDLTFGGIAVSTASPILVKSTGNIVQSASTTVSTAGGSITYWADSDGSGDGKIAVSNGVSGSLTKIQSNGGNIVLGGGSGASAAAGVASGVYGAYVGNYASVLAGSGNVTILGESNANGGTGVYVGSSSAVSGANVTLTGTGYANSSTGSNGVRLLGTASASNLLTITGNGGGTASTSTSTSGNYGVWFYGGVAEATGSGNVVINATGGGYQPGAANHGLYMQAYPAATSIRSVSGSVLVTATAGTSGTAGASLGYSMPTNTGSVTLGGVTQTGALTLRSDSWYFGPTTIQGSGPVTLEPLTGSTSFASTGLNLTYVTLSPTITALTLGKAGNTARVAVGPEGPGVMFAVTSYSVAGLISIYGDIYLGTPLATTGTGANGLVTLSGNVTEVQNGKLTAPSLLLLGTGASNVSMSHPLAPKSNLIGTLAGSGLGTVSIDNGTSLTAPGAGALTVGTVGGVSGLSASGPVLLSNYRDNLNLVNDVVTTDTSASAVTLSVGRFMAVGDTSGGNVVLNGGTLTMGTGGRALVYTGSVAGSTGVEALVGSGSGRFRYGSTALATFSTTNYTTALGSSGYYAIYRERPTVAWTSSTGQTIAYGATPVSPTADALSGFANGDTIDASSALRLASDNSLATTNANGLYNVGSYVYSRTEDAKGLGYLVSNPALTIGRATITITANDATKTYDGVAYSGGNGASYSGFATGDTVGNSLKGSLTYAGSSQGAVNANSYTITPGGRSLSGTATLNYTLSYAPGTLTVAKAPLTVRINDDARLFNEADASSYKSASYSGFVGGQRETTPGLLGGALVIGRSSSGPDGNLAGANTLAGTYTGVLTGSGLTAANYSFNYVPGNYTIVPADQLLVQVANTASTYAGTPAYTVTSAKYFRSVGNTLIDLTSRVVLTGGAFSLDDGAGGNTTFNLGAASPSTSTGGQLNVGAYQLAASNIVTNANYSNTMTLTGALQVNPKAVTAAVTSSVSKAYDGTPGMNGLALGVNGAVTGDLVGASGAGAYASKNAGSPVAYTVSNIVLAGADARNYVLTDSVSNVASNTLSGSNGVITAIPLTLTASNATKTYDSLAYSGGNGVIGSGFVNNEELSDLGGALNYAGTSQGAINMGTYTIVPSGLSSSNYNIAYGNGTLTVDPVPVTVTTIGGALQGTVDKFYDSTNVATLTSANYLLTGWVGTDNATVTQTVGSYDTANAGSGKSVTVLLTDSDYQAIGSTLLSNYRLPSMITGAVGNIRKATLTPSITANNKVYDTQTGANGTVNLTGVFSADAAAATAVASSYSFDNADVGTGKNVTASGITLAAGIAGNYQLSSTQATGLADITPAPLTVTAINSAKFVTQTDVAGYAGFAVTGLLDGQSPAGAGIEAGVTVSRSNAATNTAGEYTGVLVPSGAATIGNYALNYVAGTYTIVPARQLLVQVASSNRAYGTASSPILTSVSYLDDSSNTITDLTLSSQTVVGGHTVFTYADGANGTVSFSAVPVTSGVSAGGRANVGSYGMAANNFSKTTSNLTTNTVTMTGNLTVQPLAVTVAATPSETTYNSATQTQATTSGLLSGDAVSIAGAVSQRNAGSYTSALSVSGADVGNYSVTFADGNYTIHRAQLTPTFAAANKVYDGNTTASLTSTDNRLGSDVLTVSATGRFADKNVGTAKPVDVSAVVLSGTDAANYNVSPVASTTANITRLAQVTWVGGATGSWFDPANWAGGAVPDLANVAQVTIPLGVTVNFDNVPAGAAQAGLVQLNSLGSEGSLNMSAGALTVDPGGVTLSQLSQSGGALTTSGALTLNSLSQTAGSLSAGSLSTIVPYSHTGSGSLTVAGQVVASNSNSNSNSNGSGVGNASDNFRPEVLVTATHQGEDSFKITLLKLPQGQEAGAVHIELRSGLMDADIPWPAVLQDWILAAGPEVSLMGVDGQGIELSLDRRSIRLSASAQRRLPVHLMLQAGQQKVWVRIVQRPW